VCVCVNQTAILDIIVSTFHYIIIIIFIIIIIVIAVVKLTVATATVTRAPVRFSYRKTFLLYSGT